MRVSSTKVSLTPSGLSTKTVKAICLVNLTQISYVTTDHEGTKMFMKTGDCFTVENITLDEIVNLINGLEY